MSTPINDGGSAFPHTAYFAKNAELGDDPMIPVSGGMTLRDYFAAKAMQALVSRYGCDIPFLPQDNHNPWHHTADWAGQIADAMLAERSKPIQ